MRLSPILPLVLAITAAGAIGPLPAAAAVRSVELYAPRPFGVFIGDVIRHEVTITADPGFRLAAASLPRPGPLNYWLDLRGIELEDLGAGGGVRRHRLHLEYQSFYAPLETLALEIPAFTLTLQDGDERAEATVPAWNFLTSPLREIRPQRDEAATYLRPDAAPRSVPLTGWLVATGGSGSSALLLAGLIARHRGWWPFRTRARRPFARAVRELRRSLRNRADEQTYRTALQILHRAFDATAKRRLLSEDLPFFFDTAPTFRPLRSDIERFFAASRQAFFRSDDAAAVRLLPPEALVALGGRLAAAERAAG